MTRRVWSRGEGPVSVWAVPNIITIVRILFVPALVWAMVADAGAGGPLRWVALALFVVGIGSDAIDGHLARSRNLISDFGKILDPIADKALTGAALIVLSYLGELPWWVTGLILLREIGITIWRLIEVRRIVLPAGRGGKLKTVVQAVAISLAIAPFPALLGDWMHWVNTALMSLAFILTIWSGIDYLVRAYFPKKSNEVN
ncbi:CDP-diacylglycerol--glycerol-3-phosphate 3-phosphatidyltransferase [Gulosibacter molinativorax]|uniref:CDP-diacylglycerol--glycerol-3-phosphate 3-phosphatidyltransferase n=1 Tax=Gulosibacter molinativorax TaxID=256821 RepID=A0ABT7C943_9MICO|nr:CDP-diacylglycerol--glycerol-3-phosphate 3-phosphatidyltransferase [Gulosibacter molinativorax]MDJ1371610.1 CDP-diacylglycerol--glycerol-3-phosphate 3-phosphatidyltransferase [Gulosibacter molinativorax]QUY61047.1 PgsA protein [Gulosibacter molinativorax]